VLDTKSPKYLEMAQGHISLSVARGSNKICMVHHDDHQPNPVVYEVAIVGHQPSSALNTYEDGPSHYLTEEV
jgi:hypothetical protein